MYLKQFDGITTNISQFHIMGSNVDNGNAVSLCVLEDFVAHFASKKFQVCEMPKTFNILPNAEVLPIKFDTLL